MWMARPLRLVEDPTPAPLLPRLDDFGFDREFTEQLQPLAEWLYREYWRVEAFGVENVPAQGRGLLVANHAGVIPWDGAMIRTAIASEHSRPRHARMLVAAWAFQMPFLSQFLMKTGNVSAHPQNATALLEREELVGVFPEGIKGATKTYRERYRVQRFPITPTWPLLGLLGAIPLPSKWLIAFGEPVDLGSYGPESAADSALMLEISERVRSSIQAKLAELLPRRRTPFF
jgi:1-acyl-sn-glycerol-3-phosphate acyltransferase